MEQFNLCLDYKDLNYLLDNFINIEFFDQIGDRQKFLKHIFTRGNKDLTKKIINTKYFDINEIIYCYVKSVAGGYYMKPKAEIKEIILEYINDIDLSYKEDYFNTLIESKLLNDSSVSKLLNNKMDFAKNNNILIKQLYRYGFANIAKKLIKQGKASNKLIITSIKKADPYFDIFKRDEAGKILYDFVVKGNKTAKELPDSYSYNANTTGRIYQDNPNQHLQTTVAKDIFNLDTAVNIIIDKYLQREKRLNKK